ncbi:hypothetical protein AB0M20_18465 [Actinoplanes sp. NPDC051633]|jgi:hypothetical protein|uniref:hypothetical protein n=1 Tax=Actinoplanes sp. NPDC051633 TaxID=3155670 RepID=UPI00342F21EB
MGGEMNMWTDVVEPIAHRLTATGEDLGGRWQGGRTEILNGEAQIGDDILGGAFGTVYNGDSAQIKAIADQMPGDISGDGALAVECIGLYTGADARAHDGLADIIGDGA